MVAEFIKDHPSDQHLYKLKNGDIVFGASTISGVDKPVGPLMAWAHGLGKKGEDFRQKTDQTAIGGSIGHFLIECYLKRVEPSFMLNPQSEENMDAGKYVFEKFQQEWGEQGLLYVHSELRLVSEKHRYGGTLDIIARDKWGGLVLIDIKSSKAIYGAHLSQLSGYEKLYNENYSDPIKRRAIFRHSRLKKKTDTETRWLSKEDIDLYFEYMFLRQAALLDGKGILKSKGKLV